MIGYAMVGSNNVSLSELFYDEVFKSLRLKKVEKKETFIGYANKETPNKIIFYVTKLFNDKKASFGNGSMIALPTKSTEDVNKFHSNALHNGGTDEGKPGFRPPLYPNTYQAFIRDPDHNKLCIFFEHK